MRALRLTAPPLPPLSGKLSGNSVSTRRPRRPKRTAGGRKPLSVGPVDRKSREFFQRRRRRGRQTAAGGPKAKETADTNVRVSADGQYTRGAVGKAVSVDPL